MIVILAHQPPGGSRASLTPAAMPASGALMRMNDHPEWRQHLILAAVRRADELSRLRELPDTPVRDAGTDADKITGVPTDRGDSKPDDAAGTIKQTPGLTLPLDIGETLSTKLTVVTPEETPPALKSPERKAPSKSRRKTSRRAHHAKKSAKTQPVVQLNLLETLFGGQRVSQPATPNGPASTIRAEQY